MPILGYAGKLLRVDLTKNQIKTEKLPNEKTLRQYIGGVGLGTKLLFDEVDSQTTGTDPESRIIFMTGPLTGSKAPASSRTTVVGVRVDVPYLSGVGYAGDFWGPRLKWAGFDGIIIQGQSENPVYLWIHDGEAEIRDASKYWGKDTHEIVKPIKDDIGLKTNSSVASIGPAAESLIGETIIQFDYNHAAAKSGQGAVMGSKKLKALVVSADFVEAPLADKVKFNELASDWRKKLMNSTIYRLLKNGGFIRSGVMSLAEIHNTMCKNLSDPNFGKIFAKAVTETVSKSKQVGRPCFNCPVACSNDVTIGVGYFKGYKASIAGGGENIEGIGGNIGVTDGGAALYLTDLCDKLGIDIPHAGEILGLAFEAYEKGLLTKEQTDGLELTWGDFKVAEKLLRKMSSREGFGKVLAEGQKQLVNYIGKGAEKLATHIKNLGSPGHDCRSSWEVLLQSFVAPAGPVWTTQGLDQWNCEPDLGYPQMPAHFDRFRTASAVRHTQSKKTYEDCLGLCWLTIWGVKGTIEYTTKILSAATGWNITWDEAKILGDRIITLQKVISITRGWKVENDFDIGERLFEPPKVGVAKGVSIKPILKELISDYYLLMGWDPVTGIPKEETLKRIGLDFTINALKHVDT